MDYADIIMWTSAALLVVGGVSLAIYGRITTGRWF